MGFDIMDVLDPGDLLGNKKRKEATGVAKGAQHQAELTLDDARANNRQYQGTQLDPATMQDYETGAPLTTAPAMQLTDGVANSLNLETDSAAEGMGPSNFEGRQSSYNFMPGDAYNNVGPSAWSGDESAWDGAQSKFGGLGYSKDALAGMDQSKDYYGNLMEGGTDAQAEADYARRREQAERRRGANTQAALSGLEAKGQGGAGNALLAQLSNQQASASDQYQAGLDANAIAQARRDSAAGSYGSMSERMGNAQLTADQARAQGMDTFAGNRAAGRDSFGAQQNAGLDQYTQQNAQGRNEYQLQKAGGQDAFGLGQAAGQDAYGINRAGLQDDFNMAQREQASNTMENNAQREQDVRGSNWDRTNSIKDQNTGMHNDTSYYNQITAPQQQFENILGATGVATGTAAGVSAGLNNEANNSLGRQFGNAVTTYYTAGQRRKMDEDS